MIVAYTYLKRARKNLDYAPMQSFDEPCFYCQIEQINGEFGPVFDGALLQAQDKVSGSMVLLSFC